MEKRTTIEIIDNIISRIDDFQELFNQKVEHLESKIDGQLEGEITSVK